jgi:hypothetical protein
MKSGYCGGLVIASLVLCLAMPAYAKPTAKAAKVAPAADAVDMFDAMKAGDIEVKVIPKDSTTGNVLIKNKSNKPVTIKLPEAFVGVPVQAQFGGMGMGGMGMGGMGGMGMGGMGGMGMGGMGGMQGFGGGMGGMGMGGGMGGMGMGGGMGGMGMGGMFKVEPEKVGKLKMTIMCLEHGKKDPSPRVAYELRPVESFTSDPKVVELVKMLGRGEIDQRSAQAAAWHLANGMSWDELANKIGAKHLNGSTEPYFTASQLQLGMQYAMEAERRAAEHKTETPGKETSVSTAKQ